MDSSEDYGACFFFFSYYKNIRIKFKERGEREKRGGVGTGENEQGQISNQGEIEDQPTCVPSTLKSLKGVCPKQRIPESCILWCRSIFVQMVQICCGTKG